MISIVVPCYNERKNLPILIKKIEEIFRKNKIKGEIIIVDDNSPDGTGILAEKLAKKYKNIKVVHRLGKLGLGSAYKDGFKKASGSIIFEMDADLSHDPKYIPDFLDAINSGYDLILGSRRVKGGEVKGWNKYRKLVSFIGSLIPKVILGIRVKDLTTGYRAYTKNALKKIRIEEVESEGYFFQIETLYRAEKAGLKIKEIPIIFVDRKKGKSKLSKLEFLKYLTGTIKLKLKKF